MKPITKIRGTGLLLAICFTFISFSAFTQALPANEMRAHFIDVGQANATLLEFSCGAILIDAGVDSNKNIPKLTRYLDRFFARRTDLSKTLQLVLVTHCHVDHNKGLKAVLNRYKVKNYIDNGLRYGSGDTSQTWAQDNRSTYGYQYTNYSFDQARAVPGKKGLHDLVIDPVNCSGTDPVISLLSGRFEQLPVGWTAAESKKEGNYHSLVVKVAFGNSSFLFTGDLEVKAMNEVLKLYKDTPMLDCGVWEVSHHGSYNGTTKEWLDAVTPKYAIIPTGKWYNGRGTPVGSFNTYNFGHPRILALDLLDKVIPGNRPALDSIEAFYGVRDKHRKYKVTKNIYSSAWDGIIVMSAFSDGTYKMVTPGEH